MGQALTAPAAASTAGRCCRGLKTSGMWAPARLATRCHLTSGASQQPHRRVAARGPTPGHKHAIPLLNRSQPVAAAGLALDPKPDGRAPSSVQGLPLHIAGWVRNRGPPPPPPTEKHPGPRGPPPLGKCSTGSGHFAASINILISTSLLDPAAGLRSAACATWPPAEPPGSMGDLQTSDTNLGHSCPTQRPQHRR